MLASASCACGFLGSVFVFCGPFLSNCMSKADDTWPTLSLR